MAAPTTTAGTWPPAWARRRRWSPRRGRWPAGQPDPLINDPFAEPLVRAVGIEFFTKLVDGEISLTESDDPKFNASAGDRLMAVRTRFFDDFFLDVPADARVSARR